MDEVLRRFICEIILADRAEGGPATIGTSVTEIGLRRCLAIKVGLREDPAPAHGQAERIASITDVDCRLHNLSQVDGNVALGCRFKSGREVVTDGGRSSAIFGSIRPNHRRRVSDRRCVRKKGPAYGFSTTIVPVIFG